MTKPKSNFSALRHLPLICLFMTVFTSQVSAQKLKRFPVVTEFEKINLREYNQNYADQFQGWMPDGVEAAEEAKNWTHFLGPLGIKVRSYAPETQSRPAFAAIVPEFLKGTSALNRAAIEVLRVVADSPADKFLQVGDFIMEVNGNKILTGNDYRPDWVFQTKNRRDIQLQLGEEIDKSQRRGLIEFTVVRFTDKNLKNQKISNLEEYTSKIRIPIGKTKSFAEGYPIKCEKSNQMIKRQADFLLAQQNNNGSWSRPAGYCQNYWDTSHVALALMATGDPKYNDAIHKAAEYCMEAYPSEWTVERSMLTVFLCEYYLRFKDKKVLPAIQNAYYDIEACIKNDYICGHKVSGFGYGIAGQGINTGHAAMAIALIKKMPIKFNHTLVDSMIRRIGEVTVNGYFPYGRGLREERDLKSEKTYWGGHAMLGPAIVGASISGGHKVLIEDAKKRYKKSLGEGDNSHATSSLAFIWASVAMANLNPKLYLEHMEHFRYKLTLNDCWEGGFLKNAFPLDYQSGEGVTNLWIRSSGYLLAMCAYKRNLAITGHKRHRDRKYKAVIPPTEYGTFISQYYTKNWSLAKLILGKQAPRAMNAAIRELQAIPYDHEMVANTRKIVLKHAFSLIKEIHANENIPNKQSKAYAVELIAGIDFQIKFNKDEKAENNSQDLVVTIQYPFHELNWNMSREDKRKFFEDSPLSFSSEVNLSSSYQLTKTYNFKASDQERFNYDRGEKVFKNRLTLANKEEFDATAKISFTLQGLSFDYERIIKLNSKHPSRIGERINMRTITVPTRIGPRAIYQTIPVRLFGKNYDGMYCQEKMYYPKFKGYRQEADPHILHEGVKAHVTLQSSDKVCLIVLDVDVQGEVKYHLPRHITTDQGDKIDVETVSDGKKSTILELRTKTLEFDLGEELKVNGLILVDNHSFHKLKISVKVGRKWERVIWGRFSSRSGYHPEFALQKARYWKVEFESARQKKLSDLRFYFNPYRKELRTLNVIKTKTKGKKRKRRKK